MQLKRFLRHLFTDHQSVARAFPPEAMQAIEKAIGEEEKRHGGQLRVAVEASLPLAELLHGVGSRERAIAWFGRLHMWDTHHNAGVLIYLLLADRKVEIVGDRGIDARVGASGWQKICAGMETDFRAGNFEAGVVKGIEAVSRQLAAHFPPHRGDRNELPDAPVVM